MLRSIDLEVSPAARELFLLPRRRDRGAFAIRAVADEIIRIFAIDQSLFSGC